MLRRKISGAQSRADRAFNELERVKGKVRGLESQIEDLKTERRELHLIKMASLFPQKIAFNILDLERRLAAARLEIETLRAQILSGKVEVIIKEEKAE